MKGISMLRSRTMVCAAAVAALAALSPMHAQAACTRLAFSVNDYGKDGPTKDAKELLDKYIKKWTAERGIKSYTTGPKSVTCELFLDFIVFDEHTCKASASVCWNGSPQPKTAADAALSAPKAAPKSGERRAPAAGTATVKAPVASKVTTSSVKSGPVKTVPVPPASAASPAARPAAAEAGDAARAPAPDAAPAVVPPLSPAKGGD
jgi:hypothetical protein